MYVFLNSRMSNFDCNFFSFISSFINLTNWSRSKRCLIKLLENLLNFLPIQKLKIFPSLLKRMLWSIFPQVYKLFCHLRSNNIPTMTHILKSFDPDHSCILYWLNKNIHPETSCFFEIFQWQQQQNRWKYK